jgi:hypothetical protein
MPVPEARKVVKVAVDKLNTLSTKVKFKALPLRRMRDPFPTENSGYRRIAKWNNYFMRRHNAGNYIHVFDVDRDMELAGVAFLCQPMHRRKQVSLTFPQLDTSIAYRGAATAHETGHQLGFDHVSFFDGSEISIMDWSLYAYRFVRHARRFLFIDDMSVLDQLDCKVNKP